MKNVLQALILIVLVGLSAQSYSQVILNGGSFEAIFMEEPYTVPAGKILIITHVHGIYSVNDNQIMGPNAANSGLLHVPLPESTVVDNMQPNEWFAGYLIDVEEWGATSDVPDDEIIDNGGGGIEIYPNPTDDLASVFVDYQGDWKMTVYDLNGQIVYEGESNTPVKSIDTNALSAGIYIVSVRAKRKLIGSSQLVVQ